MYFKGIFLEVRNRGEREDDKTEYGSVYSDNISRNVTLTRLIPLGNKDTTI